MVSLVFAGYEFKNCRDCANTNGGRNFMCQYNGFLPTKDPYNIACCDNRDEEYCKPSS